MVTVTVETVAFARCFDPVELHEFLAEHWEQRPLALTRDEPGRFDDLLTADDVDRLLCSGTLRYPAFRLVKADAQLDVSDYTVDVPWRPVSFAGTAAPVRPPRPCPAFPSTLADPVPTW